MECGELTKIENYSVETSAANTWGDVGNPYLCIHRVHICPILHVGSDYPCRFQGHLWLQRRRDRNLVFD